MKNKIYRLANINIDNYKFVYYSFYLTQTISERRIGILIGLDGNKDYQIQVDANEIAVCRYAFVEVTLADFTDEDIHKEFSKRDLFCREGVDDEYNRCLANIEAEFYKIGYEAAKREFEPKWISVDKELPVHDELVLIATPLYLSDGKYNVSTGRYNNEDQCWRDSKGCSHWMPLPAPTEYDAPSNDDMSGIQVWKEKDGKLELLSEEFKEPEPQYTCAQCWKELSKSHSYSDGTFNVLDNNLKFCSEKCAKNYTIYRTTKNNT